MPQPRDKIHIEPQVQAYLNRISKHPLLKREEEKELGEVVRLFIKDFGIDFVRAYSTIANEFSRKHGISVLDYQPQDKPQVSRIELLMEVGGDELRPSKRFLELLAEHEVPLDRLRAFEEARTRFAVSNLKLVTSIAFRYARGTGHDVADLIQEGNIGLMRAVEKFDGRKGFKFSTYATWWVKQAMMRSAYNHLIRIPIYRIEQKSHIKKVYAEISNARHEAPSVAEVAELLEMKVKDVVEVLGLPMHLASLETSIGEGEGSTIADTVEDPNAEDPEEEALTNDTVERIRAFLAERLRLGRVSQRDHEVLVMRYSLDGQEAQSLESIGRTIGLTRERVRQIIKRQLTLMHGPARDMFRES